MTCVNDTKMLSNLTSNTAEPETRKLQQVCRRLVSLELYQADIRMRSHRLLRLDDNKSAACSQQVWCKLIVKTFYPQAWCKLFQQLAESLQTSSCNKSDFHRLDTTWWSQQTWCNLLTTSSSKPVKYPQLAASRWRFWFNQNIIAS